MNKISSFWLKQITDKREGKGTQSYIRIFPTFKGIVDHSDTVMKKHDLHPFALGKFLKFWFM